VHTVLPGETLPRIAGAYGSTLAALAERNEFNNPLALQVGEQVLIPVNLPLAGPEDPASSASIEGVASLLLHR
jgi:LysM repeat protein